MKKIVFGELKNIPEEIAEDLNKDFMQSKALILQFIFNSIA